MFLQEVAQVAQAAQVASQQFDPLGSAFIPAQFTASTLVVWLIDLLKRSPWFPWMTKHTSGINRFAAIVGAALTSAGIHFAITPTSDGYTMAITGISLVAFFHFIEGFAVSIASQQTVLKVYQITNLLRNIAGEKD